MEAEQAEHTAIAWPHWMLRAVATGDEQAMWDLIWSVGGSPPYGGVSYDEAKAVYDLCEAYRGPGMAAESVYDRVRQHCTADDKRKSALDAFHANDRITSDPTEFSAAAVEDGSAIAKRIEHEGLRSLFLLYAADIALREDDKPKALEATLSALRKLLELAAEDDAYAMRVAQAAQNAVSITHLNGDTEGAERLRTQLSGVLDSSLI